MAHHLRLRILLLSALLAGLASVSLAADVFVVDPVHSALEFRLTRDGIDFVSGRFDEMAGVVTVDPVDVRESTLTLAVPLASAHTGNPAVDEHLRGPDFFDTSKHPTASFVSTALRMRSTGEFEVDGSLSLHGVTRIVTFRFRHMLPAGYPEEDRRLSAEATLAIRCSDYGIQGVPEGIADDAVITARLVAIRNTQPEPQ